MAKKANEKEKFFSRFHCPAATGDLKMPLTLTQVLRGIKGAP